MSWKAIAQIGWLLLAVLSVTILLLSIPGYLSSPALGIFADRLLLEPGGAVATLVDATYVASFMGAASSVGLATFLFLKRRSDPMGLFLSTYLLGHGILFAGAIEMLHPYWEAAPWVNSFVLLPLLAGPATMALVLLFPDGRFVPAWSRWLIPATLLAMPLSLLSEDGFAQMGAGSGFDAGVLGNGALIAGLIACIALAGYAQFVRYRRFSTPGQRMQTKWVLYGLGLWLLVNSLSSIGWNSALQLPAGTAVPVWLPVSTLFWSASSLILPISLTISISRFRLFEIDSIINRTLVYGGLSATLGVVFFGGVALMQSALPTRTELATVVSTLGVVVLFDPVRGVLQKSIDRRFYRNKYDAGKTLAAFGSTARDEVDLGGLTAELLRVVNDTMQPETAAIWLNLPPGGSPAEVRPDHTGRGSRNTSRAPSLRDTV